jgi:hypothetical protein
LIIICDMVLESYETSRLYMVYEIYILCDIDLPLVLMITGCLYSNIFFILNI